MRAFVLFLVICWPVIAVYVSLATSGETFAQAIGALRVGDRAQQSIARSCQDNANNEPILGSISRKMAGYVNREVLCSWLAIRSRTSSSIPAKFKVLSPISVLRH